MMIFTSIYGVVGGLFPLAYFLRPNSGRLRLVRTRLELRPLLNACGNGSSELMSNISSSIVSMLYNFQLLKYIGEDGVSAYGVLMYVQFIFIAIDIGYSIGCAPIDKLSILDTILFSWLVFHEKLTKKSAAGLAAVVAGTLLMLL